MRRDKTILIRVAGWERRFIRDAARRLGVSLSELVRTATLTASRNVLIAETARKVTDEK